MRAKPMSVEFDRAIGQCPHCEADELARYEVLSEGGWFNVLKCRNCLVSLERAPGGLYGSLERDAASACGHMA